MPCFQQVDDALSHFKPVCWSSLSAIGFKAQKASRQILTTAVTTIKSQLHEYNNMHKNGADPETISIAIKLISMPKPTTTRSGPKLFFCSCPWGARYWSFCTQIE